MTRKLSRWMVLVAASLALCPAGGEPVVAAEKEAEETLFELVRPELGTPSLNAFLEEPESNGDPFSAQPIVVDRSVLGLPTFLIRLADGTSLIAQRDRLNGDIFGSSWSGFLFNTHKDLVGEIGIRGNVWDKTVTGTLWLYTPLTRLDITNTPGGKQWLIRIDPSRLEGLECGGAVVDETISQRLPLPKLQAQPLGDQLATARLLIVYSLEAEKEAGGAVELKKKLYEAVGQANDALYNSGTFAQLRIANFFLWKAFRESGDSVQDLKSFKASNRIEQVRENQHADLVTFIVAKSNNCGIADLLLDASALSGTGRPGRSLVRLNCLPLNTLAHEIGHNYGADHESGYPGIYEGFRAYKFNRAYVADGYFRTVMATERQCVDPCPRIPRYSSPALEWGTNGPIGTDGLDNRRVIWLNRIYIALLDELIL